MAGLEIEINNSPERENYEQVFDEELLELKVIRKTKSPHFSPAFMVNKHSEQKRGKKRMVVNYKMLNDHTKGDGYLLPNKEQLLQRIGGKNYYSSFDCKSGFWQVRLTESILLCKYYWD